MAEYAGPSTLKAGTATPSARQRDLRRWLFFPQRSLTAPAAHLSLRR